MKLLFVVQRYGPDVDGGAELYCRWLAEHLADRDDVSVLTTTARDYTTWENHYPAGQTVSNNVNIIRMPVDENRDMVSFNALTTSILSRKSSIQEQTEWIRAQGPWSSALIAYLEHHHQNYDCLIFTTYLYAPAVIGTRIAPEKSLLIPTAHNEPVAHLSIFHDLYERVAGLLYLTPPEKKFVESTYDVTHAPSLILGTGVDLPATVRTAGDVVKKYNIQTPFVFYLGRIEAGKGCARLLEYFMEYRRKYDFPLKLVLAGRLHLDIPDTDSILCTGFIPDDDVRPFLEASDVVIVPSPFESLSILLLQAFACKTPVLVNTESAVLTSHCVLSNGGLFYSSADEFIESLNLLISKPGLRYQMGINGFAYVQHHYTWSNVVNRFRTFCSDILRR